jgi:YHS domain-containing protein
VQRRLPGDYELALFRAVQEALNNAQRHSQAHHIHLTMTYLPTSVHLRIRDDGTGFSAPERVEDLAAAGHYGLLGIVERMTHLSGTARITSSKGQGTQIDLELPLPEHTQPTDTVRDPVCTALIQPDQAYSSVVYEGRRYYFCCPVCEGTFQHEPTAYIALENGENRPPDKLS